MKQAMISPDELRKYQTGWDDSTTPPTPIMDGNGWRVAQVVPDGETFPMAEPIFWTPCEDFIEQDQFVYEPETQTFHPANLPLPQ